MAFITNDSEGKPIFFITTDGNVGIGIPPTYNFTNTTASVVAKDIISPGFWLADPTDPSATIKISPKIVAK